MTRPPDGEGRVHQEPGPDLTATNGTSSIDDQAARFVAALWGAGLGWACVATLDGDRWSESFWRWPAERDDLLAHALEVASGVDVYVAPALRSRPRRTKDTAVPGPWAWADLDFASDEARDRLGLLGAMVVTSGSPRSWHAYLPLAEVPEDVEELELLNRRLARYLGADRKWDASAVLRLPGTFNRKVPTLPRPVTLERLAGAPWSRDDLDGILPTLPPAPVPETATVDLDVLRARSTRVPYALAALVAELPGPDRSGQAYRLVAEAVQLGLHDKQVLDLTSLHRPTVEKFGDRLVTETYRSLGKLRPAHLHVGRSCAQARCPNDPRRRSR